MKQSISQILFITTLLFAFSCDKSSDLNNLPGNSIPVIYADYIHITASIDGENGIFLIDTGADNLYLDSIFFENRGFLYKNMTEHRIEGIGTGYQDIFIIQDSIDLCFDKYIYRTTFVPVLKLKPIGGDFIDGLLGTEFFEDKVLEINYAREYIIIHKSIDSANLSDYLKIPLIKTDHSYVVPVSINVNGTIIEGGFLVDVATPSSSFTSLAAYKNNLNETTTNKVGFYSGYGGIGGETTGYEFVAQSVSIAGLTLNNAIFSYSTDTAGMLEEGSYMGFLGNNILDRFDLIFDFPNHDLYLKKGDKFNDKFYFNRLGFGYVDRFKTMGGWIVTGLYEGSEAERLGLRIDDVITSVNGIPVESILYEKQEEFFKSINKVNLLFSRGDQVEEIEFGLDPM